MRATGCTAPAAGLLPYLEQRKKVDLFVVVSDEEENTSANSMFFAPMFKRYRAEVNPNARVFLVSFLSGPSSFLGKMRAALRREGIDAKQFRLDGRRPDLSKLPHLMGMVAIEAASMKPREPEREADGEEESNVDECDVDGTNASGLAKLAMGASDEMEDDGSTGMKDVKVEFVSTGAGDDETEEV